MAYTRISILSSILFFLMNIPLLSQDTVFNRSQYQNNFGEHPQDPVMPKFLIRSKSNDYQLGIGGFVKLNGIFDFVGLQNYSAFITEEIPVGENNIRYDHFKLDARQTRIYTEILGNTPYGKLKIYIECDFFSEDRGLNIRHAYGYMKGFLLGQTWTTLMDLEAVPNTVDFEGPSSLVTSRIAMIRYTQNIGKNTTLFAAVEAPYPMATYIDYTQELFQYFPDLILRARFKNDKGHISLGGVYRHFTYKDTLHFMQRNSSGLGLSLSGSLNISRKLKFMFQGFYGDGVASYIQDFSFTKKDFVPAVNEIGKLVPLPVYGAYGALEFNWSKKLQSTLVYSYLLATDIGNKPPDSYQYGQYIATSLFWYVLPNFQLATEFLYGERVNRDNASGTASRINFMAQFNF